MRIVTFAAFCLAILSGPALAAPPTQETEAAVLDRVLARHRIPAMSLVVIRDGAAAPEVARGVRRIGEPEPVRAGERWLLGSDTKAMTAVLIGRLVERKKLSWTARLDQMLPELAADMRPEYRDVTLVDLLSHRAGLPEAVAKTMTDEAYVAFIFDDNRTLPLQRLDYLREALRDAPIAPPRTKNSYSNTGYILAAAIAERAAGEPYEVLMERLVFRPLKIRSATFAYVAPGDLAGHANGRVASLKDGNPAIFNGAGQVRMTMQDWARFCVDQLDGARGRGKLLKPATYRMMQSIHGGDGVRGWGFGWQVQPTAFGRQGPAIFHSGSDGTWIADVVLYPNSRSGLLIATNAAYDMKAQDAVAEAMRELAATVAPPAPPKPAS